MKLLSIAILLLATPPVLACSEEGEMQDSIQEVRKKHEARLMAIPGVVSVGIGRDEGGEAVIVIGLEHEQREMQKPLPQRLGGYGVRTEVIGKVKAR